ncbi:MAG: PD-(D/E)XK nuclease family protein [Bacteroidaceae bacterium]|nr:PD-(D/E)XK nuclease family protein [Bacteroidaceae bacterium]MBR1669030.1 PD-(D/E)XK nuclease family protein [Bacteroidaceae bacterium]
MVPFLKIVADDLYKKLEGDFQDTTIIFPNKRASLFFNEYLWENSGGKTIWTPEYTTISELFTSLSDCTVGDSIELVLKLWEVYQKKMQPTQSLDQQFPLMETMLSDFQDIDNNLVEPRKLFLNIADLKELTDFSFLEKEQKEAIEQFFGKFFDGGNIADTLLKTKFRTMWNCLADIYEKFHEKLLQAEEPMVYEGMLKRMVVETLTGKDEEARKTTERKLTSKTYVMVGFNVLNKTELELFRYIKQHHDAKFYWDYDVAYTKRNTTSKLLSKYEAGQFILENIRQLGDEFEGKDLFQNMCQPKEITFIQSPTENAQTRYIDEWKRNHVKDDEPLRTSAVILCNENLLQPVLHSIGDISALNVTMGYPLSNTPVYSLIQALLELQVHGRTKFGAWRYKYVAAVLKHSFIQRLVGQDSYEKLRLLSKNNVVFPSIEMFADNNIMQRIFTPASGKGLTTYLSEIISRVGHSYQEASNCKDFTLQIYKESLFVAYTVVNRIHTLQEGHTALAVGDDMLMRLIIQLMAQATIPFHGEPAIGLQVMGLLETRNLDFRNVIMLSVNEGQMPKGDKRSSLIPYTLRAAYGMTTIEKEVSLYAYYYYRLMQRAETITLLYNTSTDSGGKGEMSRFMLQTLAEKDDLFGEHQEIALKTFTAASETLPVTTYSVKKTTEVMEKLHVRFNKERILSPSAINTYMKCPLKFYFNYVAELRPDKEVSEDVDKSMFGILFHDAMHHLYQPYEGRPFSSSEAEALATDEALITQQLNNTFATQFFKYPEKDPEGNTINYSTEGGKKLLFNGTQLINRHVIRQFIINQIKADAQMARELEATGGYWQIISQEQTYKSLFSTFSPQLLLGGIIDRLDLLASPQGDRIRIVDYKTSNKQHTATNVEELFDPEKCTENYHIMQTLYYSMVLTDSNCQPSPFNPHLSTTASPVVPALMYCAKDYGKNYSGIIKFKHPNSKKQEEITDFKAEYAETFNTLLSEKIAEIFTPYQENAAQGIFSQCTNEKNCQYCDFLTFCRRHPKKN